MGNGFGKCCIGVNLNLNLNLDEEFRYICCPERGAALLRDEIAALVSSKEDIERATTILKGDPRKQLLREVETWVGSVDAHRNRVKDILDPPRNNGGCSCCCFFRSNHSLGVEVNKELQMVKHLKAQKDSWGGKLAEDIPLEYYESNNMDGVVGMEKQIAEVVGYLRKDGVAVIGIYGMGGAGKTTLVREVTRRLRSSSEPAVEFDSIISVVVSRNPDVGKIQNEIAKQIGFSALGDEERERANLLSISLSRRNFLLVLDDVWETLDFRTIGIPVDPLLDEIISGSGRSRVVLTTRDEHVCVAMGAQSSRVELRRLEADDSWKLFRRTIKRDDIWFESGRGALRKIAEEIVHRCGGLPLLLVTVARALANKETRQEWEDAKDSLKDSASEIRGMEIVYEKLKFSYDNLRNDDLRSCLLYSALFPEDHPIFREDMVDYFVAGGESDGSVSIERLRRNGRITISELVDSCLPERGENRNYVKVHDAIRDMTILWLGKDDEEDHTSGGDSSSGGRRRRRRRRIQILSLAGKGLEGDFEVGEILRSDFSMVSLQNNRIRRVVSDDGGGGGGGSLVGRCNSSSSLQVLLLNYNERLQVLSEGMFHYFPILRVLDLRGNEGLEEIPASVGSLKSLRYLNVKGTGIKFLPKEMSKLTKLMQLDLTETPRLREVPGGVFSCFAKLQSLYLIDNAFFSYMSVENVDVLGEVGDLTRLKTLHLSFRDDPTGVWFLLKSAVLSKSTTHLTLERVDLTEGGLFQRIGSSCKNLEWLNIKNSSLKGEQPELTIEEGQFSSLKRLEIANPDWKLPDTITIRGCESLEKLNLRSVTTKVHVKIRCGKRWWEGLDWHGMGGRQPSHLIPIFETTTTTEV